VTAKTTCAGQKAQDAGMETRSKTAFGSRAGLKSITICEIAVSRTNTLQHIFITNDRKG